MTDTQQFQSASQRGVNPYRPGGIAESAMTSVGPRETYDPRAKGVDGDMLDAMLKGRWQEGYEDGTRDGRQTSSARYPDVFDDGYLLGHRHGTNERDRELSSIFLPLLQSIGADFTLIEGFTGSPKIKEICQARVEMLRAVLEDQVGRYGAEGGGNPSA